MPESTSVHIVAIVQFAGRDVEVLTSCYMS